MKVISSYPDLVCSSLSGPEAAEVNNKIGVVAAATSHQVGCVGSGLCTLAAVSTAGCLRGGLETNVALRRKRSAEAGVTVTMTFYQSINVTEESVETSDDSELYYSKCRKYLRVRD